eukprot:CAMPEP_0173449870 /NCGR_PEP_ID=MMETSP1357-20121228/43535_1 /TAXON_ID=77926 /ORGANISM="Hemiselmis rufescens, Strain PCC563" /LENGTH=287 /DNA_ID=CAMNT_0014416485 /DNA_START=87 /DNA_END=947 /DNA_ORIENTATION=+
MPLLPGETRDRDTYQSGLGFFFDDGARSVRRWADTTQVSAENWWRNLKTPSLDGLGSGGSVIPQAMAGAVEGSGPAFPLETEWEDPGVWRLLLAAAASVVSDVYHRGDPLRKCPGTVLLIAAHVGAFTHKLRLYAWGLNPARVAEGGQVYRLLSAPFVHASVTHLASNMASLLHSGYALEPSWGHYRLIGEAAAAAAASSALSVSLAVAQHRLLGGGASSGGYHRWAVGFSAAAFALRVFASHHESDARRQVAPRMWSQWAQFGCWAEVAAAHVLVPASDVTSHLCG